MIATLKFFDHSNMFSKSYSTLVTFVRHAQSAGNAKRPITFSYSQYPITELGECQAEKLVSSYGNDDFAHIFYDQIKSQVKNIQIDSSTLKIEDDYNFKLNVKANIDSIISSPFRRTVETAKYLHKKYPCSVLCIDDRLRAFTYLDEVYYTSLRYSRNKEIEKYWVKLDPLFVHGKGAESFKNFYERTLSFFYYILESGENWKNKQIMNMKNNKASDNSIRLRNIVVFTHAMPCRMLELIKFGYLPCCPNKSTTIIDSSSLLKSLNERRNGVSIPEAQEVMKIYLDFKKRRSVDNCEAVTCLL